MRVRKIIGLVIFTAVLAIILCLPEERAQAEARAQKIIAEDQAEKQSLLYDAAKYAAGQTAPRFCRHCGAKAGSGKICEYCGMPL